ncbi:MAG: iron-sulfur cluster assembly accessory protein [Nitrospirae bacterium]|nr:iron-sulfur cluster assembly accessory protein [Nitrospirota bacterium]
MLDVTDSAVKQFKKLLSDSNAEGHGVRIFAADGGCCGPSLAMSIANKPENSDITIQKDELKIFLEKEANKVLSNATINYSDENGFAITGMQGSSCCG